jgi:hypothetical protein
MHPQLIQCRCQHCGAGIEFNADDAGQEAECPHCHQLTWIDAPDKFAFLPKKPPVMPPAPKPKKNKSSQGNPIRGLLPFLTKLIAVALFWIAIGLIFGGCTAEFDEEKKVIGSAIRQNVYVVQYCAGFVLLALSPIVWTTGQALDLIEKNNEPKDPSDKK